MRIYTIFAGLFYLFTMKKISNVEFPFYTFEGLSGEKGILHFVSSGLKNIGFSDDGRVEGVVANRKLLAKSVGFRLEQLTMAGQVHSTNIRLVGIQDAGRGAMTKEERLPETDALVTNESGVCLAVLSADCVPVLLYDPEAGVIAAVHAGWRGTAGDIAGKTVGVMREQFGCRTERIMAGIGPSIGRCCFEVGAEVADVFRQKFLPEDGVLFPGKHEDKYQVDLWEANRRELIAAGLTPQNIEVAGCCTVCGGEGLFSYRRDGESAGRFGAGIMLI